jgi:hypothetical protein
MGGYKCTPDNRNDWIKGSPSGEYPPILKSRRDKLFLRLNFQANHNY